MPILEVEARWAADQYVRAIQAVLVEAGYDCRLHWYGYDQLIIPSDDYAIYAIYIRLTGTKVQVLPAMLLLSEDADLADPNCFDKIIADVKKWRR